MKFHFKKYVKEILKSRFREVHLHFSKTNKKFLQALISSILVQEKIIKELREKDTLFYEYEEFLNHAQSIMLERIYLQGIIDGMRFSKFKGGKL